VTYEYDDAARTREREERTIECKAENDQLRGVWLAQEAGRARRRNGSGPDTSNC
jgi:hypothetical protein